MTGFDRLREQMVGQKDKALIQVVDYLLSRKDMEQKYLNEEKDIDGMAKFVQEKGKNVVQVGWNYITNEVVFAWAIMYFAFPNSFLKIKNDTKQKNNANKKTPKESNKNNIISMEEAKKKAEENKKLEQISLFGGMVS